MSSARQNRQRISNLRGQPPPADQVPADQAPADQPPAGQAPASQVPAGQAQVQNVVPGDPAEEVRLLAQVRALERLRNEQPAPTQASVTRALYAIPTLMDKNYETWDTAVADALLATGMYALYTVTTKQRDDELPAQDVRVCNAIPQWQLNIAWSAIRHAISIDSPAYALTLGLQMGDVKALLRAIRLFYRKTAINEQHQVLSTLRTTMQADSSLRNYMAALETNFIRLTKLGYTLPDDHKRFYLLEGLSEDYTRGVKSTILAFEFPDGSPCTYSKAQQILTSWADSQTTGTKQQRDTAMVVHAPEEKTKRTPCRHI